MKKILIIFLITTLIVGLVGCGESKSETSNNSSVDRTSNSVVGEETTKEQVINQSESNENDDKNNSDVGLELTHKVPGKDIYIDYTNKYQNIEYGFTEVFTIHTKKIIAFTSDINSNAVDLQDAHMKAWDMFELCMQTEQYNRIKITEEEYVTINGIDMYRYVGTMPYEHEGTPYDGYAVGYTFIIDGVPCCLVGSVLDYEQSPEIIEEIDTMVEAMIQTVRTVE